MVGTRAWSVKRASTYSGAVHPTLQAVQRLAPLVRDLADACERERALPSRLHLALAEAGVYRMLIPSVAGGDGVPLPVALRVVETLATADGSVGWCAAIGSGTQRFGAFLEPEVAAATVWADPTAVSAGVFAPSGRARATEDGYLVSGRWTFASGCRHAAWFFGNCVLYDGDTPLTDPEGERCVRMVAVPIEQVRIHDTWRVAGLRGTGSHDVEIDGIRVPAERAFRLGADPSRVSDTLAAFPFLAFLDAYLAVVVTGIARGALDAVTDGMAARAAGPGGDVASLPGTIAFELGRLEGALGAARAALFGSVDAVWARVSSDGEAAPGDQLAVVSACQHAVRSGREVVSRAFMLGGVRGLFEDHPLQRALRDVHAAGLHAQFRHDRSAQVGRELVAAAIARRGAGA